MKRKNVNGSTVASKRLGNGKVHYYSMGNLQSKNKKVEKKDEKFVEASPPTIASSFSRL